MLIAWAWGCDAPVVQDAGTDAACRGDTECDDGLFCTGIEQCTPDDPAADARGCIVLPACVASDACDEAERRCVPRVGDAGIDGGECDADGDGHDAEACGGDDCDDEDRQRYPGNPERCEGTLADHDEDCEPCTVTGAVPDGDADDDLYPSSACTNPWLGDIEPVGCDLNLVRVVSDERVVAGADCNDASGNVRPNQVEVCGNGIDDNCDGSIDEGRFFRDNDNDGRGDPAVEMTGSCTPGWVTNADDCDDARSETYLGARELCDGLDNDCSLAGDMAGGPEPSEDMDGDLHAPTGATCLGFGDDGAPTTVYPRDDCDDALATTHPGADERCDAAGDEDCDGMTDESGAVDARDWYVDGDGDTYGAGTPVRACVGPAGRVDRGGDCRDTSADFRPGAGFQALPYCGGTSSPCGAPPYTCGRFGCTLLPFPPSPADWDYNCDGLTQYEYPAAPPVGLGCTNDDGLCRGPRYLATSDPPVCGETRTIRDCSGAGCTLGMREVVLRCR